VGFTTKDRARKYQLAEQFIISAKETQVERAIDSKTPVFEILTQWKGSWERLRAHYDLKSSEEIRQKRFHLQAFNFSPC
jgi:hypothetical protein